MDSLLAVDLGLKTAFALYKQDGRLFWYRSQNFGTAKRLRQGVYNLLGSISGLAWLVLEGGGSIAEIWEKEAERRQIAVIRINAEQWRRILLYPREHRSGTQAKHNSDEMARRVISWSGISRPKSLRHDTAEAILIGLWAVLDIGWLKYLPPELRH
ncbi:MAG: hypothetical protein SV062_07920 [Thermodesulfobacteriota bacterium]|nr:hypothetical protein [Thermodesulfobacteriota bacterium]